MSEAFNGMAPSEWLKAHAGVIQAGRLQGDLCSRDFARDDVERLEKCSALLAHLEGLQAQEWKPIEQFRPDRVNVDGFLFLIAPKTADEAYVDSSNHPVVANFEPYVKQCKFGCWNALSKATHFYEWPVPPTVAAPVSTGDVR